MPEYFITSTGLRITLPEVVSEILEFMSSEPRYEYKITVGTDSELFPTKNADFVSAIVVHRVGNGGRYFWHGAEFGPFHTLRDRIIREVLTSLDLGKELLSKLRELTTDETFPKWSFEIHADIGENGPTNVMIQEVVGMIRAHNFDAVTKPYSYAATNVADRHV
jgi:uncharacterized protein